MNKKSIDVYCNKDGEKMVSQSHPETKSEGVVKGTDQLHFEVVKLKEALEGISGILSSTIEMRDPYTAGHSRRVAKLACAIAEEMGLSSDQIQGLRTAGLLHDIGKISTPSVILVKSERLTEQEFDFIKAHVKTGYKILKPIEFPWPVARMVLEHHERINGSGYPCNKKGDELLVESKILAVADAIEAMSLNRPYRKAIRNEKVMEEILAGQGVLFDSEVVDACSKLFKKTKFEFI